MTRLDLPTNQRENRLVPLHSTNLLACFNMVGLNWWTSKTHPIVINLVAQNLRILYKWRRKTKETTSEKCWFILNYILCSIQYQLGIYQSFTSCFWDIILILICLFLVLTFTFSKFKTFVGEKIESLLLW